MARSLAYGRPPIMSIPAQGCACDMLHNVGFSLRMNEVATTGGLDHRELPASLEAHLQRFGRSPNLLAGDRGVFSPQNEELAQKLKVKQIVLPATGRVSKERKVHESQGWFRRGFRFRAGIEGRIRVLKRDFGLGRCPDHGDEGMERWVGWGVVTANLAKIAETQAARQASGRAKAAA